jgi:hypothetical protein
MSHLHLPTRCRIAGCQSIERKSTFGVFFREVVVCTKPLAVNFRCHLHQIEPRKTINIATLSSLLLVILIEISSLFQLSSISTLLGLPYFISKAFFVLANVDSSDITRKNWPGCKTYQRAP